MRCIHAVSALSHGRLPRLANAGGGVGAAASDDAALKADYAAGDVYHALARLCGLTPDPDPARWKRENAATRQRMKVLQLGISYGMGVPSLARGLDRHPLIASVIIERHKRKYTRFWQWRETRCRSRCWTVASRASSWPLRLSASPNRRRSITSQCKAAARKCCGSPRCVCARPPSCRSCSCMTASFSKADKEQIEHAKEIMLQAGRDVCDGLEIGCGRPNAGGRRPLSRHAPDGDRDVGHHNARLAGRRSSLTEAGRGMTGVIVRHGRRIEVETDRDPALPRDGACGDTSSRCRCRGWSSLRALRGRPTDWRCTSPT